MVTAGGRYRQQCDGDTERGLKSTRTTARSVPGSVRCTTESCCTAWPRYGNVTLCPGWSVRLTTRRPATVSSTTSVAAAAEARNPRARAERPARSRATSHRQVTLPIEGSVVRSHGPRTRLDLAGASAATLTMASAIATRTELATMRRDGRVMLPYAPAPIKQSFQYCFGTASRQLARRVPEFLEKPPRIVPMPLKQ